MITQPSSTVNDQPIDAQLAPRNIPYRVNKIIRVDDHCFEIMEMYDLNYFQENFATMQKKFPKYQFIVKDNNLIVVAKEIQEAECN